jgi:hypothetical protein
MSARTPLFAAALLLATTTLSPTAALAAEPPLSLGGMSQFIWLSPSPDGVYPPATRFALVCNEDGSGTLDYTVSGVVELGPYSPGALTETGSWAWGPADPTISIPFNPPSEHRSRVTAFSSTFDMKFETTSIHGTKTLSTPGPDQPWIYNIVLCEPSPEPNPYADDPTPPPTRIQPIWHYGAATVRYDATITTSTGVYRETGTGGGGFGSYEQWALSAPDNRNIVGWFTTPDSPPVLVRPLAPTSKEDCVNGKHKDFGFKNQGQCVAAVSGKTTGRPAK